MVKQARRLDTQDALGWKEILVWLWVAAVDLGLQVLESSRNYRVGDRW